MRKEARNTVAITVYVEPNMYDFINSVRWGSHNSKTEQVEQMLIDWRANWITEHGGEKALETMRKWAAEAEEKALLLKEQRK